MLHTIEITPQPLASRRIVDLLIAAVDHGGWTSFDGAFAYATVSGVQVIASNLESPYSRGASWNGLTKRWLVAIDWMRSEPAALELLNAMPNSSVRIVDGANVVTRPLCTPKRPWHPKAAIFAGTDQAAVVHGSGNLSRNGLTSGHEVSSLLLVDRPRNIPERSLLGQAQASKAWFDGLWGSASPYAGALKAAYESQYKAQTKRHVIPIDDDAAPTTRLSAGRRGGVDSERLRQLRACEHLWIFAGNLHHNRGAGNPGDQLMLSPMTRVFFGSPAEDRPTNSALGYITITRSGVDKPDCSLRFSDNSMDVLTLPVPGTSPWPAAYDRQHLLFTRVIEKGQVKYRLDIGGAANVAQWKRTSRANGSAFRMTSGREWGVF
jgi:HKD family nuclease